MGMTAIMLDNKALLQETQGRTMEQHTTIVRAEPLHCVKHKHKISCLGNDFIVYVVGDYSLGRA